MWHSSVHLPYIASCYPFTFALLCETISTLDQHCVNTLRAMKVSKTWLHSSPEEFLFCHEKLLFKKRWYEWVRESPTICPFWSVILHSVCLFHHPTHTHTQSAGQPSVYDETSPTFLVKCSNKCDCLRLKEQLLELYQSRSVSSILTSLPLIGLGICLNYQFRLCVWGVSSFES